MGVYPDESSDIGNPMLSRFLSPDPGTCPDERSDIGIQAPSSAISHNRYAYCMNNPFMYTDPDGYNPLLIIGAIFAGNYIINWLDNTINKKMSPKEAFKYTPIIIGANYSPNNNKISIPQYDTYKFEKQVAKYSQELDIFIGSLAGKGSQMDVASSNKGNPGLLLANAINTMPPILFGPIPIINPMYGAAAISIDGGGNLVGAEINKGITLMLRGKDIGQYTTYSEIAGGGGTGGSIGGEITRYDFSGGNNNLRLSYIEGFRHKAYGGVNAYGVLGVGIAGSWSEPVNGYRVFGTTFSFGVGLSPFLIDAGYNGGEVTFDK